MPDLIESEEISGELFDIEQYSRESRKVIDRITAQIRHVARSSFVDLGSLLLEVRPKVRRGEWESYIRDYANVSVSTGKRALAAVEKFGAPKLREMHVAPTVIYRMTAATCPDAAVAHILKLSSQHEYVNVKLGAEIIGRYSLVGTSDNGGKPVTVTGNSPLEGDGFAGSIRPGEGLGGPKKVAGELLDAEEDDETATEEPTEPDKWQSPEEEPLSDPEPATAKQETPERFIDRVHEFVALADRESHLIALGVAVLQAMDEAQLATLQGIVGEELMPEVIDVEYPSKLDTPEFRAAWQLWLAHRSSIGSPLRPTQARGDLAKLAKTSAAKAIRTVDHSLAIESPILVTPTAAVAKVAGTDVEDVIEYYQTKHPRSRPDAKIKKMIRERLAEGRTVVDLKHAIDGNHLSPYHCGENDDGTKYHSLGLIVRDASHVDMFIAIHDDPPKAKKHALGADTQGMRYSE